MVDRANEENMKSGRKLKDITKMYSFDYIVDGNKGEAELLYRRHSNIGQGKRKMLTGLTASKFEPRIESPYTETGRNIV